MPTARTPLLTFNLPVFETVVAEATPPDCTAKFWPLVTTAPLTVTPESMFSVAPDSNTTPVAEHGTAVAGIIDAVLGIQIVTGLFGLVTIIPNIAIAIRRLHDLDRTGWWILLGFIPLIGWIILLIWYVTKGTDGPNRFGPDPLATLAIPAAPRAA